MNKLFTLEFALILVGCSISKKEADVITSNPTSSCGAATSTVNASYNPTDHSVPSQVGLGGYCCNALGIRRCVLDDYYPLGLSCWCYGQGNGWVCR